MHLTLHTGWLGSGIDVVLPAAVSWFSFAPFPCQLGLRRSNSFSGADEYFSSPEFNFFLLSFAGLTDLCFGILSLINLFPQIVPFLPGDGVLGCLELLKDGLWEEQLMKPFEPRSPCHPSVWRAGWGGELWSSPCHRHASCCPLSPPGIVWLASGLREGAVRPQSKQAIGEWTTG